MNDKRRQEDGYGVRVSARLPVDLAASLAQRAKAEDHSVSAEIRRAVRRHVAERRKP